MRERQRLEYLQAMGIEVWQSRHLQSIGLEAESVPVEAAALAQAGIADSSGDQIPAQAESAEARRSALPTEMGLCLVKYPECLAVVDLPLTQVNLSAGCQHLLDDVVKVLGVKTDPRTLFQEKEGLWEAGTDENLRNRVSQLLGGASSFILLFGDAACQLLLGKKVESYVAFEWMGRKTVAGKGLEDLLHNPMLKKSLWLSLQQHLAGH